jgi:predicted small integral membrane protein
LSSSTTSLTTTRTTSSSTTYCSWIQPSPAITACGAPFLNPLQIAFYDGIIAWESLTTVFAWIGVVHLSRAVRKPAAAFNLAKRWSVIALTLAMLLWFVAFISVGGEWFLMWQSKIWNGQEAAFRMFACIGIVFLLLAMPDADAQP